MTGAEVLELLMDENDADANTIRDYLKKLLETLWEEGEGFSGKRPFGNSGWDYDLYICLVQNGAIKAKLDPEEGWIDELSEKERKKANKLIFAAIEAM